MACYCQYCRFVYPAGTANCFSCGRPTSTDASPSRFYIDNGYQAIGEVEDEPRDEHGSRRPVHPGAGTGAQAVPAGGAAASVPSFSAAAGGAAASAAGANSAASVLQGEDIRHTGEAGNAGAAYGFTDDAGAEADRELENLRRLQEEQERQRRDLNRQIRRRNLSAWLISFPWRPFSRFMLFVIIGAALIAVWTMRDSILSGIGAFIGALGSWLLSLIISLLPLIIVIYLIVSLIRGHF